MAAMDPKTTEGIDNPNPEEEVQELDNISSIALLIDDLSHEDPSIKINALSKLINISQLIGMLCPYARRRTNPRRTHPPHHRDD